MKLPIKLFLLSLLFFNPVLAEPSDDIPDSCFYITEEENDVDPPVEKLVLADIVEETKKENIDVVKEVGWEYTAFEVFYVFLSWSSIFMIGEILRVEAYISKIKNIITGNKYEKDN